MGLVAVCQILLPQPGIEPGSLHWELGVLSTGPLRMSLGWLHLNLAWPQLIPSAKTLFPKKVEFWVVVDCGGMLVISQLPGPLPIFFLRFLFWWGQFLKSLLNLLQYCFCFMFWFFGFQSCGILALWPGIELAPPALEGEVLTTGSPGKSLLCPFKSWVICPFISEFKSFYIDIFSNLI